MRRFTVPLDRALHHLKLDKERLIIEVRAITGRKASAEVTGPTDSAFYGYRAEGYGEFFPDLAALNKLQALLDRNGFYGTVEVKNGTDYRTSPEAE